MAKRASHWPLVCLLGLACDNPESAVAEVPPAAAAEPVTLRLCGSTTLGDAVLPKAWESFVSTRRGGVDASLDVSAEGSVKGLEALSAEACDLAMFSGPWSADLAPRAKHVPVGKDAVLVMTAPANPATGKVSVDQLRSWYSGKGRPKGVQIYGQPEAHGTHRAFSQLVGLGSQQIDATFDAVGDIPAEGSWVWYESAQRLIDRSGFTPVAVQDAQGVAREPSLDTMIEGVYPLMRDLHLVYRPSDAPAAALARDFATWVSSPAAAPIFEAHSMLHVTSEARSAPVSGRCDPPALVGGDRVGRVAFETQKSEVSLRGAPSTLRRGVKRAIDKGADLVVVAYASSAESDPCALAGERGKHVEAMLGKVIDELAKTVSWGARLPETRVVVAGPTKHWGVRPADNQRVLVVLSPAPAKKR